MYFDVSYAIDALIAAGVTYIPKAMLFEYLFGTEVILQREEVYASQ